MSEADTAATGPFAGKTPVITIAGNEAPASEPGSTGPARYTATQESPDPRLAGALELSESREQRPDGSAEMSGTGTLTNDKGTWKIEWSAVEPKTGHPSEYVFLKMTGTGDYAGLVGYFQGVPASEIGISGSDVPIGAVISTGWIEKAP